MNQLYNITLTQNKEKHQIFSNCGHKKTNTPTEKSQIVQTINHNCETTFSKIGSEFSHSKWKFTNFGMRVIFITIQKHQYVNLTKNIFKAELYTVQHL